MEKESEEKICRQFFSHLIFLMDRRDIHGVPWDFMLPSSTLAFKVVSNKEFMNMKYDKELKNMEYYLQNFYQEEEIAWNTLYMRPKSPDLGFVLFLDHLLDSFLKPYEFISYLKVICAQFWGPKVPFWDLRSAKMSSRQAHSCIRMKKTPCIVPEIHITHLSVKWK